MTGSSEKVARDLCLSALRNDVAGLQATCSNDDADPDDLEFDYEATKKAWDEYLNSQRSYIATITTNEDLKREEQEHNALRNEFNAALKLTKKTIKRFKLKDEPSSDDVIKKAKADIASIDKRFKDSVAYIEQQLLEVDGKLSSFHLDDIKETALRFESQYQSQLVPAYKGLMEISSDANVEEVRKEMDTSIKDLQLKIWNINDLVNNKKVLLSAEAKPADSLPASTDGVGAVTTSMMKPQNFHKKLEFPSFESGQERDYPSFKRKWKATVATAYPNSVQRDIIQDKVPKEVEPEIKNAESMEEVWKILDSRYGQPDVVSGKLIRELRDVKFSSSAKQDCQKFIELYSAYVKARNDLKEIGMLDCLKHGPTIDSVVSKLPGQELKTRWAIWKAENASKVASDGIYEVWNSFMEKEIETARILRSTLQIESKTSDEKIKCNHCQKPGHKEKDCYIKYPSKKVAKTNSVVAKPNTVKPSSNCPACNSVHSYKNKQGLTLFTTRMNKCNSFLNMSAEERASLLDKVGGCALCTDYSGSHQKDKCDATVEGKPFKSCSIQEGGQICGKRHNHLVHGTSIKFVNAVKGVNRMATEVGGEDVCYSEDDLQYVDTSGDVLLKFQDIRVKGEDTRVGMIFWDDGSTVCLIREGFANKLKIQGRKICLWVQSAGHRPEK